MRGGAVYSYGIICFRMAYDAFSNTIKPFYVMVQRKDSICFVEFVRGKYNVFDADYIRVLIGNMTVHEAEALLHAEFDDLWRKVWVNAHRRLDTEYRQARQKFEMLRRGFQKDDTLVNLVSLVAEARPSQQEQEWEFPKGRRGSGESGLECALREFEEEAGVPRRFLRLVQEQPIVFTKLGCNEVLYKFVYFLVQCAPEVKVGRINDVQAREIMTVRWLDYKAALRKLRVTQHIRAFTAANASIMRAASFRLQPPPVSRCWC